MVGADHPRLYNIRRTKCLDSYPTPALPINIRPEALFLRRKVASPQRRGCTSLRSRKLTRAFVVGDLLSAKGAARTTKQARNLPRRTPFCASYSVAQRVRRAPQNRLGTCPRRTPFCASYFEARLSLRRVTKPIRTTPAPTNGIVAGSGVDATPVT